MLVDFHTHILPKMDDGSKNKEESVAMLRELKKQGIDTVVATPHFYADRDNVEKFLKRREKSYAEICDEKDLPNIVLGAEVLLYDHLYSLDDIDKLCIGNTNYIMIELPFEDWSPKIFEKLFRITVSHDVKIIIAHIDRYLTPSNKKLLPKFAELKTILQINTSAFNEGIIKRRHALGMIKSKQALLLGSDCHNMTSRKPDTGEVYSLIKNKLGEDVVSNMNRIAEKILF